MSEANANPPRRWFQFSLRSLLIAVMLAAGLLVAWRAYVEPYRRQRESMAYIEHLGGEYKTEPGGPGWLHQLFGDDKFQNIIEISLDGQNVSDEDLAHLEGLTHLQSLRLGGAQVSDAGLARLREFTILRMLDLEGTLVSDAGLAHLEGLVNLQTLVLSATPVGDAGLVHLKGLKNLQELWLGGAQVSDAGAKQLQKALPNCRIYMVRYTQDGIYP